MQRNFGFSFSGSTRRNLRCLSKRSKKSHGCQTRLHVFQRPRNFWKALSIFEVKSFPSSISAAALICGRQPSAPTGGLWWFALNNIAPD